MLGFPPRLNGRGVAAVRRTPEERRVLYLAYTMDRADAVTIRVAVLDRVERSLKAAYEELKEARIIDSQRAETTAVSPATSPWKRAAVPTLQRNCNHRDCNMDRTSEPSPAVLGGLGLERQLTIANGEAAEPARRVSPRHTGPSPSNQPRAESESDLSDQQPRRDSKAKKCWVPCLAGACVSRSCVSCSYRSC